jgi:ribokinase
MASDERVSGSRQADAPRASSPDDRAGRVVVVGSVNVDLVYAVDRLPAPGETVSARAHSIGPGGKGLNQALAAHRSGARTTLIAAVGDDEYGRRLVSTVGSDGLDVSCIRRTEGETGRAVISVDSHGENSIVLWAGANGQLHELSIRDLAALDSCQVLVAQLEVPDDVVVAAAQHAEAAGATIILNPTPVRPLPAGLLRLVGVLVVNEHEAEQLAANDSDVPCVITTLGPRGAAIRRRGCTPVRLEPRMTTTVDTTGAGDTFVGSLAAGIARGETVEDAAAWAITAASLSVEQPGAYASIPTREQVVEALEKVEVR